MADKQQGFEITIKARDEMSAKVKQLNNTLKELEQRDRVANADRIIASKKEEIRMRNLNQGTADFGKNSRAELASIAKSWGSVGGKIGGTIDSLGKAAKLGGVAIALGAAIKGVEAIGNAYMKAADNARVLHTIAVRTGADFKSLQIFQQSGRAFGISPDQMSGSLTRVRDTAQQAFSSFGQNPIALAFFKKHGITKEDLNDPVALYDKIVNAIANPTKDESADPSVQARALSALGLEDNLIVALMGHAKEWNAERQWEKDHGHPITEKSNELYRDLNRELSHSTSLMDGFKNELANAFSDYIPTINQAIDKTNELGEAALKWMHVHPEGVRGIANGLGQSIISSIIPGAGLYFSGKKLWEMWKGGTKPTTGTTPGTTGQTGGTLIDKIAAAIEKTESGNGYNNAPLPGHSATGPMQMLPDTFNAYAKPGESISNPDDNRAVARRYIAKLIEKYGNNPDTIAYSYANGSPHSPDRNKGYLDKFRKNFGASNDPGPAVGAVKDLASATENQDPFKQHDQLHNYCAHLVNMSLKSVGLPPITNSRGQESDIATDASGYGSPVDPSQGVHRGDIGVSMYGHGRGEPGGHAGVFTGRTKPDGKGGLLYEFDSSHSQQTGTAGSDWRHVGPGGIDMIRRASPMLGDVASSKGDAEGSFHEVTLNIEGAPPGARLKQNKAEGKAALNTRVRYSMQQV